MIPHRITSLLLFLAFIIYLFRFLQIFVDMGGPRASSGLEVYVVDFEEMLLSNTADYYSRESAKCVARQ